MIKCADSVIQLLHDIWAWNCTG